MKLLPGLEHLANAEPPSAPVAPLSIPRTSMRYVRAPQLITNEREAAAVVACMMQQRIAWVGLDTEYSTRIDGTLELLTVQLAPAVQRDGLHVWKGVVFDVRDAGVRAQLARLLLQPCRFVVHYARAEFESLTAAGLPVPFNLFDTHLAARLCTLGRVDWRDYLGGDDEVFDEEEIIPAREEAKMELGRSLSLLGLCKRFGVEHEFAEVKEQMQRRFMNKAPLDEQMIAYAAEDARVAAALYPPLVQQLMVQGLLDHFERIEMPAQRTLLAISSDGVAVDTDRLARVVKAAERSLEHYTHELTRLAFSVGVVMDNPRSHQQRLELVRGLGLDHLFRVGRARDGKPRYSFERERRLKRHREKHPAIEALYRYALLSRIPSDRLFRGEHVDPDGRVRSRIEPLGADTGRPSFSEPNLASLPRIFRPVVVADDPDQAVIEIDFKAQEPGIAAAHYGDEKMIDAWNDDGDFYLRMGRDLGVDVPRPKLKLLTLASTYGQTARSAAENLGMEVFRAQGLLNRFFASYPQLAEGMKEAEDLAEVRGYAETRTGLKRYLNPKASRRARGRQARNLPVQGGGADVLKVLLPRAQLVLRQLGGRILVPLFDSLVFQVPREHQQKAIAMISHEMVMATRSLYPELRPKLDVNDKDTTCWNKDGHGDSIDTFEKDPTHDIR